MEAHSHFGKIGGTRSGQGFAGRRASLLVALISAVLAGVLIYMFVSRYNHGKTQVIAPTTATVFVARQYIAAGTPDSTVAARNMLKSEVVPVSQVLAGAITNPAVVTGQVVSSAVAAGQQVTATDFSHANVTISSYLSGNDRAVAISIDPAHGLTAYLRRGDTVDVMAQGTSGSSVLFENIDVLANHTGDVVLRLNDQQALALANAEGHDLTIWLALRPASGATNSVPPNFVEKF